MGERERIHGRWAQEPRLRERVGDVTVSLTGPVVVLEGTVERLATKRLAARIAAEAVGATEIEDRVQVRRAAQADDQRVHRHIVDAFTQDPYIDENAITATVHSGVVTLTGTVGSLATKRLAGVIAWWIPGVVDVRNQLTVTPPEEDSDAEIRESVITALDKDPLVDHTRIAVGVHDGVVTLRGTVPSDVERECAEEDCWAIWGVREVHNHIAVDRS